LVEGNGGGAPGRWGDRRAGVPAPAPGGPGAVPAPQRRVLLRLGPHRRGPCASGGRRSAGVGDSRVRHGNLAAGNRPLTPHSQIAPGPSLGDGEREGGRWVVGDRQTGGQRCPLSASPPCRMGGKTARGTGRWGRGPVGSDQGPDLLSDRLPAGPRREDRPRVERRQAGPRARGRQARHRDQAEPVRPGQGAPCQRSGSGGVGWARGWGDLLPLVGGGPVKGPKVRSLDSLRGPVQGPSPVVPIPSPPLAMNRRMPWGRWVAAVADPFGSGPKGRPAAVLPPQVRGPRRRLTGRPITARPAGTRTEARRRGRVATARHTLFFHTNDRIPTPPHRGRGCCERRGEKVGATLVVGANRTPCSTRVRTCQGF